MGRAPAEERPYHHGDLSHALLAAARRLLETQGPSAVTLRAVAREAGVSPAAPYHHFQDKQQLMEAIAHEGWTKLEEALDAARAGPLSPREAMNNLGVAYVTFARENPPLYRVMYDTARDRASLPDTSQRNTSSAYAKVRETLIAARADPSDSDEIDLTTAAAWCFAHGLAEMAGFKQFAHLKAICGGEAPFIRAVFRQLGLMDELQLDRGASPYAEGLRDRAHAVAREAQAVLSPTSASFEPAGLERTFTIRANEGFVAVFAANLVAAVTAAAPSARLRFSPKPDKDARPLRDGQVDLEIGVAGASVPEVRSRTILRDRFVGAVRNGHSLLTGPVTPERYAACHHVVSSRRGASAGPVDDALQELGLKRHVVVTVPGFPDAINIARRSDLVALIPHSCFAIVDRLTEGLSAFELPVQTPGLDVAAMWHPRLDSDPAHRWLRETVIAACRQARPA